MALKEKNYTLLSNVDHKMQYVSIIAVISAITPTIYRKKLTSVVLELTDTTMHGPGFLVRLKMEGEVLSQFMDVARRGLIIKLIEIKIIKNEGSVYGEVRDKDELKLYNDRAVNVIWHSDEKSSSVSDKMKTIISELLQWKTSCFLEITPVRNSDNDSRSSRRSDTPATVHSNMCNTPLKENSKDYGENYNESNSSKGNRKMKSNTQKIENHIVAGNRVDETKTKSVDTLNVSANENSEKALRSSRSATTNFEIISVHKEHIKKDGTNITIIPSDSNTKARKETKKSILTTGTSEFSEIVPEFHSVHKRKLTEGESSMLKSNRQTQPTNFDTGLSVRAALNQTNEQKSTFLKLNKSKVAGEKNNLSPTKITSPAKSISHKIEIESSIKKPVSIMKPEKSLISPCVKTSKGETLTRSLSRNQVKNKMLTEKENEVIKKNNTPNLGKKSVDINKKNDCHESKKYSFINSESDTKRHNSLDSYVGDESCTKHPRSSRGSGKKTELNKSKYPDLNGSSCFTPNKCTRAPPLNISDSSISSNNSISPEYSTIFTNKILANKSKPVSATTSVIDNKHCNNNQNDLSCEEKQEKTTSSVFKRKKSDKPPTDQTIEILKEIELPSENVPGENSSLRNKNQKSEKLGDKYDKSKVMSDNKTNNHQKIGELENIILSTYNQNYEVRKQLNTDKTSDVQHTNACILSSPKSRGRISNDNVLEEDRKILSSPRSRGRINKDNVLEEDRKQKQTRSSICKQNETNTHSVKAPPDRNSIFWYLKAITRNISLRYAESIGDVSFCELEEIDVSEKFHLECKVISQFTLFEDGIQVIRVQDGSICKAGSLTIPESSSWNGVIDEVLKNPVVKKNSPFIDIIIFDFTRMQSSVVPGKFYTFKNVMAVKFQLKDDPRPGRESKIELFFCAEGQNIYNKYLNLKEREEINKKLNNITYRNAWKEVFGEDMKQGNEPLKKSNESPSLFGSQKYNFKNCDSLSSIDSPENDQTREPSVTKKRKFNESNLNSAATSPKRNKNVVDTDEEPVIKNDVEAANKNQIIKDTNLQSKLSDSGSSNETVFDETPGVLKEISEIMHEESALGLPFTESEDIHLKNSGSEVTFSQFCQGAKYKVMNFRSSTQVDSLSEDIVLLNGKESAEVVGDGGEMEPLTYFPSGSSESSAIEHSPAKRRKFAEAGVEMVSQKCKADHHTDKEQETKDSASDISNSSSIKIISSNSSDVEFQVVDKMKDSHINRLSNIENLETKSNKCCKGNLCNSPSKQSPEVIIEKEMSREPVIPFVPMQRKNESTRLNCKIEESKEDKSEQMCSSNPLQVNSNETKNDEHIEVVSDDSSNISFFSIESHKTANSCVTTSVLLPFPQRKNSDLQSSSLKTMNDIQKIPGRCFFKSRKSSTKEELKTDCNIESSSHFFSHSSYQTLPALPFHVLRKLIKMNYMSVIVTLVSITPNITDSWRENCIKSRCSSCKKLYDVFNAANNIYNKKSSMNSALPVGSHIVCPDSQCCNQILDSPEFYFSLVLRLRNGTSLTAYIAAKHAENIFGCTAQETLRDEKKLNHVKEILEKISIKITNVQPIKVDITRKDLCNPQSGPLFIQKVYL